MKEHMQPSINFGLLLLFVFSIGCQKSSVNQLDLLPPETSSGMNTFGCILDGNALLPRDGSPNFSNPYPSNSVELIIDPWNDLADLNISNASTKNAFASNFYMILHFTKFSSLKVGVYKFEQSSFGTEAFPYYHNHLYGSFYDPVINQFNWFGSFDSSVTMSITRLDTLQHIFSANFNGILKERNGINEVIMTNGRFDINWRTISNKKFP
jgi:hypothetical protein